MDRTLLYRTIWRWHFYAGLFVMPMVLVLAITGAVYLFKPQVDAWEERAWRDLPATTTVSADQQVKAALAAFPRSRFSSYRLPEAENDAALIHVALPDHTMRDVFVSPDGKVLGSLDPEWRIMQVAHDVHGQLMLGKRGSWLVELAAGWAIVMILSGIYLCWPARPRPGRSRLASAESADARCCGAISMPSPASGSRASPWCCSSRACLGPMSGAAPSRRCGPYSAGQRARQDWTIGGAPAGSDEHAEHQHGAMAMGTEAMPMGTHRMADGTLMAMSGVYAQRDRRRGEEPPPALPGDRVAAPALQRALAATEGAESVRPVGNAEPALARLLHRLRSDDRARDQPPRRILRTST
jgi:hypothetical protein